MLRTLSCGVANRCWMAASWPAHLAFQRALSDPREAQTTLLQKLLRQNRDCAFARQHQFNRIRSVADYQAAVPIRDYEELLPWIEQIKHGMQGVLTTERVIAFEKTSGSSSAAKYVPYTRTLLRQFQAAIGAWIWDLYRNTPGLANGSSYWCITPLARPPEPTCVPVGLQSDADYLGAAGRFFLQHSLAVPPTVAGAADLDNCLDATSRFLLQANHLSFISVWNSSFLMLLLNYLEEHADELLADFKNGFQARRARQLKEQRNVDGRFATHVLWPKLKVISCWTDAAAKLALPPVIDAFPHAKVQGKGLLATEGVVSVPLLGREGHCLALTSHFLEFVSSLNDPPKLAHELSEGEEYSVVITTGGGLWRYRLGDRIRVVGFIGKTPAIEFIGREDGVSDLRGEKLNPVFASQVIQQWQRSHTWTGSFAMLAPVEAANPFYSLFMDGCWRMHRSADRLDELLSTNPHYDYCRRLGQLQRVRIYHITGNATEQYLRHCERCGQRAGNIKPTSLHKAFGWEQVFSGGWMDNVSNMTPKCSQVIPQLC